MAKGKRRTGGRAGRVASRQSAAKGQLASYIERKIPYFNILSTEALELIEHNADTVLEEIGIDFKDDPGLAVTGLSWSRPMGPPS
jgi:trimethylamine--corrinoid protein Co-methyltransferase